MGNLIIGTEEWFAARRKVLTASDAKKILKVDPHGTPLEVWQDKKGILPPKKDNDDLRRGRVAEGHIADLYAIRTGFELMTADFRVSEKFPWLGATPDRLIKGRSLGLECKDRLPMKEILAQYGDDGTSFARADDVTQSLVNAIVFEAKEGWDVAVHFDKTKTGFRVYRIQRDEAAEKQILEYLEWWWNTHVVKDVPPEATDTSDMAAYLKNRYAVHQDTSIAATPEIELAIQAHLSLKQDIKNAEAQKESVENTIKEFMKENALCIGTAYQATWKKEKDSLGTNWESVAKEALEKLKFFTDKDFYPIYEEELLERNKIITKIGARKILTKSLMKELK